MSYGLLTARPELKTEWTEAIRLGLDPGLPTRWEEYRFVYDNVRPSDEVLDIGTGHVPEWHRLPEILSPKAFGILAIDADPRTLELPEPFNVFREVHNLYDLPDWRPFDVVVSVSVFEHLYRHDEAFEEMARLVSDRLILTADNLNPDYLAELAIAFGLDPGDRIDEDGPSLNPEVSYLVARRAG